MKDPARGTIEYHFSGFHDLMKARVREILLVSSLYDAYVMEEDGRLSERLLSEYEELNLRFIPRITRVSTAEEALSMMERRTFDLVITMMRILDMNPQAFGRRVKDLDPDKEVLLLTYEPLDTRFLIRVREEKSIDKVFYWSGDSRLLLAVVKYVEDLMNIDNDSGAGVQSILVVEDSPRFYSMYLPILYTEIMTQTRMLISESANDLERLLRMRARPKILLAETYEEAMEIIRKQKNKLLAVISDLRFPRQRQLDPRAGLKLLTYLKNNVPDLPVLLQSAEPEMRETAYREGFSFIDKNSDNLLFELRQFVLDNLGFGDFVFRSPRGTEIARASNLAELHRCVREIPDDSLLYHARRNHFSIWLRARTEFALADKLRPQKTTDFSTTDELRQAIAGVIQQRLDQDAFGLIRDFESTQLTESRALVRLGSGSLGGKARGIAFMSTLLGLEDMRKRYRKVEVLIPETTVLCAEAFDEFLESNHLHLQALESPSDSKISDMFLKADLPRSIYEALRRIIAEINYPLAVRSSSILEDCQTLPFAGIYKTFMLPNNHEDPGVRLEQLCNAVKMVYASIYYSSPRQYVKNTNYRIEEEKMAVMIQRVVGSEHDGIFYPSISGVAQSYNFYPFGPMKQEDGIAFLALGLGRAIVEGGKSFRFSPHHPQMNPPYVSLQSFMKNTQTDFFALDLSNPDMSVSSEETFSLVRCPLERAEKDGTLRSVASTYAHQDHAIKDTFSVKGPRVVTFAPILKHENYPLAEILQDILAMGQTAMGTPVEIEFAMNLPQDPRKRAAFYLLQIRPMVADQINQEVRIEAEDSDQALCLSHRAMGNGQFDNIRDLIYVDPEAFDIHKTRDIAAELSTMNGKLDKEGRPYILMGFGRWATSDPYLGVPVQWHQISAARVFVEANSEKLTVEPSQGSHFFQNMLSLRLGYFFIDRPGNENRIDWEWLMNCKVKSKGTYLRHLRFDRPLLVKLDGRTSRGVILKPAR
ncbi:MAG TPA: DUF5752 family protein [Thermoanaerobaculia bacterium]|mgnify:CR=1 FL=1|nr:DUF5752 family protein [Thermoanaerobaculia bacterium]HUM30675.1 DUF5752 family protein [Thermoanaerobaculia bacterium]HXK68917.1 DUF5752 family protein [Thermoanaerobaculia bacterium]